MKPLLSKKIIKGCEAHGTADDPFLTRWTLLSVFGCAVCLHRFHRSDNDEMHDHPWSFVSIVLWNGYVEETPCSECAGLGWAADHPSAEPDQIACDICQGRGRLRKRFHAGSILRRPADWVHRVELVDGRNSITLLLKGPRSREWGFWTVKGWQHWKDYFKENAC